MDTVNSKVSVASDGAVSHLVLRVVKAWLVTAVVLAVVGVAGTLLSKPYSITDYFFYQQDLPGAGVCLFLLAALLVLAGTAAPPALLQREMDRRWACGAALIVFAVCWAGARLVCTSYGLSGDEFMAQFDARILRTGSLTAPLPREWQDYRLALQPMFLGWAGAAHWVSGYLPVNAAFLAVGSVLGSQSLVPAVWAALSVLATFGVARRLWPDFKGLAPLAALFVATSPQVLITGMTPYAMSAHLAANMVWLWLILGNGRVRHGCAILVALLGCGIHQLAFFPLFAAPFVLEMWLSRRWRNALAHTAAFALILGFWNFFPTLRLQWIDPTPAGPAQAAGSAAGTALNLLSRFDFDGLGLLAKNLLRFMTWQNLLAVPLALLAAPAAWRQRGDVRALLVGLVLTGVAMFILLPFQGHGWGYRYFHGLIGSTALLAAWGWVRAFEAVDSAERRRAQAVMTAALIGSALVLVPFRAWQAREFVQPYAQAANRLLKSGADVLIIDDTGMWYGQVLLRNDPFLAAPVMLYLENLTADQVREVCGRHQVRIYGGEKIGPINPSKVVPNPHVAELRALLADLRCGQPL